MKTQLQLNIEQKISRLNTEWSLAIRLNRYYGIVTNFSLVWLICGIFAGIYTNSIAWFNGGTLIALTWLTTVVKYYQKATREQIDKIDNILKEIKQFNSEMDDNEV